MNTADLILTDHAVERYIERIRPGADDACARADMRRLLAFGKFELADDRPVYLTEANELAYGYIVCGSVAFPIIRVGDPARFIVTTTIKGIVPRPERAPREGANRRSGRRRRNRRRALAEAKAA